MFEIEEQAANTEIQGDFTDNSINAPETQSTPPVETVDQTKAFAQRLKQEKAKAKEEAKKEIAESFGYNSWQEYVDAQTNDKIIGKGMDPDAVKDVLKDLIYTNPDYVEAMKYKQEKEELEKEIFASNSIEQLNKTYGTNYKSVDELDKQTIDAWNAGTPLVNAYAAYNMSTIIDSAVKKAMAARDSGKSHLKTVSGSTEESKTREISQDELRVAKAFGLDETKFKEYVNKK